MRRVYEFLGSYIRERQREGAMIDIDPAIVVRAFIGMIIHHSLNNNLWDPQRRLLNLSNRAAAETFTAVLLREFPVAKPTNVRNALSVRVDWVRRYNRMFVSKMIRIVLLFGVLGAVTLLAISCGGSS